MDTSAPDSPALGANLLRGRRPKSAARRWLVIISLIAHAGAIGAYVVLGMLRVERLTPEHGRISVAIGMKLPDGPPDLPPGKKPKDPPKPKVEKVEPKVQTQKIQVDTIVQPTTDTTKVSTTGQTSTTTTTDTTGGGGGGGGGGGEPCVGPSCDQTPTTSVKHDDPPPKLVPKELVPKAFKALRITPDAQTKIQPSNVDKTAMLHAGLAKVSGVVRACIDTSGRVTVASLKKSTGYPDYDVALVRAVRSWDYRPATVDGKAVEACGQVFFDFMMQ